jgi:hypothetical protein
MTVSSKNLRRAFPLTNGKFADASTQHYCSPSLIRPAGVQVCSTQRFLAVRLAQIPLPNNTPALDRSTIIPSCIGPSHLQALSTVAHKMVIPSRC